MLFRQRLNMATYINRKFLRSAEKNMSVLFILLLILFRMHTGSADNDPTHIRIVSDLDKSLPSDNYYGLNYTENSIDTRTTDAGIPATGTDVAQPGKLTPSPVEPTADVLVTNVGRLFIADKFSSVRFIPSLSGDCLKVLEEYAIISSDFVFCALVSSKPLLFCESCVNEFVATIKKYEEIENMKGCGDILLSSDRVQIMRETQAFLRGIWDKGSCKHCFQNMKSCEGNVSKCLIRKDVLKFQIYINQTLDCFHASDTSEANVCNNCSAIYKNLTEFYVSMGSLEEMCVDCVEQMNSTRKEWSIVYNCTYSRKDVVSIVAISVFFCSFPLFFYAGSKVHTAKIEYKLMKQSRLKRLSMSFRRKLPSLSTLTESYLTEDSTGDRL